MSFGENGFEQGMELFDGKDIPETPKDRGYYERLGVSAHASEEELKKAFKRQARESHPDLNPDKSDDEFKAVGEAYETVSNSQTREEYDKNNLAEALKNPEQAKTAEMSVPSILKSLGIDINKDRSEFTPQQLDTIKTCAMAMHKVMVQKLNEGVVNNVPKEDMETYAKLMKLSGVELK